MKPEWVVLKFGGTSVAGKQQWQSILNQLKLRIEAGQRVLLVCSAVSGITNLLTELASKPEANAVEAILQIHIDLAGNLGVATSGWLQTARERILACLQKLELSAGSESGHEARADLLAVGEWLSTRIGCDFLQQSMPADWLDVREHLFARDEPELSPARQWLSASCEAAFDQSFLDQCNALAPVLVTQGFIASNPAGKTMLLGRGGSDTSAALLAGRLGAERVEIWTDVPGLFTADPRLVTNARLLEELDFEEALEMAASGAKVVHPSCIKAAADTGTAIWIRDTNRPGLSGTWIKRLGQDGTGVKTVTCQRDMLVLLLQKIDSRREVGFLAGVFDTFRLKGISVDLVATSETTTTVALNRSANHLDDAALNGLLKDLGAICDVQVHADCVCVNLVGNSVRTALPLIGGSMEYFETRPLLMLSQSANDLCLSLLMPAGDHEQLIQQLHHELIVRRGEKAELKFGPSWQDLQRWE